MINSTVVSIVDRSKNVCQVREGVLIFTAVSRLSVNACFSQELALRIEAYTIYMAVPRHHMAKGKQLRRRSHLALKPKGLSICAQCGKKVLPHTVCKHCGYYKGKEVVNVLAKKLKKSEKNKGKKKS